MILLTCNVLFWAYCHINFISHNNDNNNNNNNASLIFTPAALCWWAKRKIIIPQKVTVSSDL